MYMEYCNTYKYWFKDMSVFDGDYTSFETAIRHKYNMWLWENKDAKF